MRDLATKRSATEHVPSSHCASSDLNHLAHQPEFEQKLKAFTDASKVINSPDDYSPAKVNESKLRYSALSNELLPASTEFEKLRDDNAKIFRKTLSESAGIDG